MNCITNTSLLHTRDLSLYAWEKVDTIGIRSAEESRVLRRSDLLFRSAAFNPYLGINHSLQAIRTYILSGTSVLVYRVITLRRILQRLFVSGQGVIYMQGRIINDWERIDWSALEEGQEVESEDKTRKERVS